ncbi:L-rhamnose-binding lectin SML-like [Thalassophryne amazonica]|uniref:L-rhamnose-binding lectin SML-like n=1 Tax=Thalassophryne amazonica TaxID=390379 RepID=UPI00147237DF|nr:L-rhamnose-binding lectin SML-like [Thalassophryne amazonica]
MKLDIIFLSYFSSEKITTCGGESFVHHLSCESGVISVVTALYGREDRQTCSEDRPAEQLTNTQCSLTGVVDFIKNRCNGKKMCDIGMGEIQTSDPCVGTYKYLQTNYNCLAAIHLVTCEHSYAHLECAAGQVLHVYGADYGRRDHTTCSYKRATSQVQNVYCSTPTSKVAESCNGKTSCTIKASNTVFEDPCVDTYKYLEVAYTCLCKLRKQQLGSFQSSEDNLQRSLKQQPPLDQQYSQEDVSTPILLATKYIILIGVSNNPAVNLYGQLYTPFKL